MAARGRDGQRGGRCEPLRGAPALPGPGEQAQRVRAEVAPGDLGGHPALGVDGEQLLGCGGEFGARVEDDGRQVEVDAAQHVRQRRHRYAFAADGQPQTGDTVLQIREHGLVCLRRIRVGVALAHVPAGQRRPLGPAAAHERREARVAGIGRRVVGGVEGTGPQAVLDVSGESVLGQRAFDVLRAGLAQDAFDKMLPLPTGWARELGGQREPFGQDRHGGRLCADGPPAAG